MKFRNLLILSAILFTGANTTHAQYISGDYKEVIKSVNPLEFTTHEINTEFKLGESGTISLNDIFRNNLNWMVNILPIEGDLIYNYFDYDSGIEVLAENPVGKYALNLEVCTQGEALVNLPEPPHIQTLTIR